MAGGKTRPADMLGLKAGLPDVVKMFSYDPHVPCFVTGA
jgi:hypothetical protein